MSKLIREIKKGDLVYLKRGFEAFTPLNEGGPIEIDEVVVLFDSYSFTDKSLRGEIFCSIYGEFRTLTTAHSSIDVVRTNNLFRSETLDKVLSEPKELPNI